MKANSISNRLRNNNETNAGPAIVPTLYIFSGLPGTGKSTLAKLVAQHYRALYLRIDTIEQGLRDLCSLVIQSEGYRLSYRIAGDNLRLGLNVVADSCNPIELTRREWEQTAREAKAEFRNIESELKRGGPNRLDLYSRRGVKLKTVSIIPGLGIGSLLIPPLDRLPSLPTNSSLNSKDLLRTTGTEVKRSGIMRIASYSRYYRALADNERLDPQERVIT